MSITIPDTVQSVIMSRIDRLEDEARYVLQSASVIGRLFRHRLLGYITSQEQQLDEYLWKLEERDLVYEQRAIPELEYSFRHVLTQETAYNTILSRRRREFHRKVAEGYEALYSSRIEEYYEELAYHYSRSDSNQKALDYLVKAGDKSREAFANNAAIDYYTQALALTDEGDACVAPTIGHIYHSLSEIYFPLLKYEESLECCQKALEYVTEKKRRVRIYGMIGWVYQQKYNQHDTALDYLNKGIAELGDDAECPEMAWLSIPLFWVAFGQRDYEKAIEIAQRGLLIVENTAHYFETTELCRCLAFLYSLNNFIGLDISKSYEYGRKSLEAARNSGNLDLIGRASVRLGHVHLLRDEYDDAEELVREGIEMAQKAGNTFLLGQVYSQLSEIYEKKKDWNGAIECLEHCLEIPGHPLRALHLRNLARVYAQNGGADKERIIEHSKEVLESFETLGSDTVSVWLAVMEELFTLAGKREEFISYCNEFREEKSEALRTLKLKQWYLEPLEISESFTQTAFVNGFDGPGLISEWEWVNPGGDSSYNFSKDRDWLELHAASGSDLWKSNFQAPRLIHEISENFVVEVQMRACSDEIPSVGGLLVWVDQDNFILFENGYLFENEIRLTGCLQGEYDRFGRGKMASDILYLRLERIRDVFSAYCSGDGENWMICGQIAFSVEDPIKVGIYALGVAWRWRSKHGDVDTATQFGSFRVLRKE
jgi:tetratricopeptide (TPR) repeat protein/regulation of enolase protein 1 (concanavalin A-like superfamily)